MFQFFPEEEVTLIGEGENGGDPEFLQKKEVLLSSTF